MTETNVTIPNAALDDRLAFVGTAGSGKTYAAGTAVERLLSRKARVVVVDPLDVWYGLRVKKDGKAPAFPVVIFGGAHGDLPLNENAGSLIGETVARMKESCIVSLGGMQTKTQERRFMLAFLDRIYRSANGEPLHIVFDEADLWAPQKALEPLLQAKMEEIVRRGRVKGFIPWLITQRPAVIAKDVLSQVDGLVAMKLTSSHDRKALGAWIEGQADQAQEKEFYAKLPTMQRGQGILWIPGRGVLEEVTFPKKSTFDSSATPKRGEPTRTAELKPVDLGKLKTAMAKLVAQHEANDPKKLRARIAELELQAGRPAKPVQVPVADPKALKEAEKLGFARGEEIGWVKGAKAALANVAAYCKSRETAHRTGPEPTATAAVLEQLLPKQATPPAPARSAPPQTAIGPSEGVSGPGQAVLNALAWWGTIGHASPKRAMVCGVLGWNASASHIRNTASSLKAAGLIEYPGQGRLQLTPAGSALAATIEDSRPVRDVVSDKLSGPQRQIFDVLIGAPAGLDRRTICEALNWEPGASHIRNTLASMKTLQIVEYPATGIAKLSDWVF